MTEREKEIQNRQIAFAVRERLRDYQRGVSETEERAKLVALWKQHHPEAAREASVALHPLALLNRRKPGEHLNEPDETWNNDVYVVTVRHHKEDPVFNSKGGMIQLGISALDGTARHDWREFQAIKNQLAGPECEAFELYPADSRLLDPSNYYTLWCFPSVRQIKVGQGKDKRRVFDQDEAMAPQRALAK
jgi:hypothetical protein